MKPRVLLDCDGVLANFCEPYIDLVNQTLGRSHTPADVTQFDITTSLNLTYREEDRVRANIGHGWCEDLPVYPHSQNGVAALEAVADVYVVTASMGTRGWETERRAWLKKHYDIHFKRVIFASAKYVCAGQYLIDDRSSNLEKWSVAHPSGVGILWRTPYNHTEAFHQATNSWDDLHRWVSSYAAVVEP